MFPEHLTHAVSALSCFIHSIVTYVVMTSSNCAGSECTRHSLTPLRPGWFVDSHGCLESELFDLDSAPANPTHKTNSRVVARTALQWKFKDKSKPHLAFRANKIKNVSTSNWYAQSRWIQDLRLSKFFIGATIGENHRVSDAVKTSIDEVTHEKVVCVGAVAPYLSKSQIKLRNRANQLTRPFPPWTAPPNRRTDHGCPRKSWMSAATTNKYNWTCNT